MESINEVQEFKKTCRIFNLPGEFEKNRHQCRKFISKKRYELNKKNNYYNNYYDKNKEIILKCQKGYKLKKKLNRIVELVTDNEVY